MAASVHAGMDRDERGWRYSFRLLEQAGRADGTLYNVLSDLDVSYNTLFHADLLNGPPIAGNPTISNVKWMPLPEASVVAVRSPLILLVVAFGNIAM